MERIVATLRFELQHDIAGLAREYGLSHRARGRLFDAVCNELANNPSDVVECVVVPAADTTKSVLAVRASGNFKSAVAKAANNFIRANLKHGNHLH